MIRLLYEEAVDGKLKLKDHHLVENFDSHYIMYCVYHSNTATVLFFDRLTTYQVARIGFDLKYDRECFDIVKNQGGFFHPVEREEFLDWLKEHHPDIMTHLLWYI